MREYNSETDYPLLLEAARKVDEVLVAPLVEALRAAGINPRYLDKPDVDRDIIRAWAELGLHPKRESS